MNDALIDKHAKNLCDADIHLIRIFAAISPMGRVANPIRTNTGYMHRTQYDCVKITLHATLIFTIHNRIIYRPWVRLSVVIREGK